VVWNHLFAAPGDRPEWYEKVADWLPMIIHLQPPAGGHITRIRYDRFSPYFNEAASYGLDLVPYWSYAHAYPLNEEQLAEHAYFFCHDGPVGEMPVRLMQRVNEWSETFYEKQSSVNALPRRSESAPVLEMSDDGGRIVIRDTRPCAVAPRHELGTLESEICRVTDAARNARAINSLLRASGLGETDEAIASALQRLVDWKIVADFDGRYLCLAVDENPIPYLGFEEFAGGLALLGGPWRRSSNSGQNPWETPIVEMF
jgi:magnesium-protoporphyrin IX monomethyl ester (oxidative) cyclase